MGQKDTRIEALLTRFKKMEEEKKTAVAEGKLARQKLAELGKEAELLRSLNEKLRQEKETLMMEASV